MNLSHCTEERFLNDVKEHELTVVHDSENGRHLKFRKPGTICYGFDLITWPGFLSITGDLGCYVFSRLPDMFEFFRMEEGRIYPVGNKELSINPGYWGQKLKSICKIGGFQEFSEVSFRAAIKDHYETNWEYESPKQKGVVWRELKEEILDYADVREVAFHQAYSFKSSYGHRIYDWEADCEAFTFSYIWCLYAIVWGISKYDELKAVAEVKS